MARKGSIKKEAVEKLVGNKTNKKTTSTTSKSKKETINEEAKKTDIEVNENQDIKENIEQIETEKEVKEVKTNTNISDDKIPEPVNVLDEEVNEKDYAAPKIEGMEEFKGKAIPEQQIIPQNIHDILNQGNEDEEDTAPLQAGKPKGQKPQQADVIEQPEIAEPKKNILADDFEKSEDSRGSSERLAKFVVKIYKYLWLGMGKLANITPDTVANRIAKGKLNPAILSVEIEIEKGVTKTVLEFVKEMSEKIDEITTLSKGDEKIFLELLTGYFIKKGWGLSAELDMILAFGEHFITTGIELLATRTTINGLLRSINEQLGSSQPQQPKQQAPPPNKNDVDIIVDGTTTEQAENIEVSEIIEPEENE